MGIASQPARYGELLTLAGSQDHAVATSARDELVALALASMTRQAHRAIRGFRRVRRWCETEDIVQEAALRLHRALITVVPESPQAFLGLAAVQVRRELLDLARRFGGRGSLMRHLDTNAFEADGQVIERTALALDDAEVDLDRWVVFHEVAASLPEASRQIFDMVWYLEASQEDIAATLQCSTRTVRRRWEEAKRIFQERFHEVFSESVSS